MFLPLLLTLTLASITSAYPLLPRSTTTNLTSSEIQAFKPYTYYAAAAHCAPNATFPWTCGKNCDANPSFTPVSSGKTDNNRSALGWYVGYDPALKTIIVAHGGGNGSDLLEELSKPNITTTPLDPKLFPGINSTIRVYPHFQTLHNKTALPILSAVKDILLEQGMTTPITLLGHGDGGALALLNSIYLPLHLPSGPVIRTITYGMPGVGNQAFAKYVDSREDDLRRVVRGDDPIPSLPGTEEGFWHVSGEVMVLGDGTWVGCGGQENGEKICEGDGKNLEDYYGPYDEVVMEC